jgi:hypothetical protein
MEDTIASGKDSVCEMTSLSAREFPRLSADSVATLYSSSAGVAGCNALQHAQQRRTTLPGGGSGTLVGAWRLIEWSERGPERRSPLPTRGEKIGTLSGSPDLQGELSEMVPIECAMRRRRTIQ